MILADKIIRLRKKNGWSQEELAERMEVSRQAVSKWEGAQTVPDLGKILMLANLFGVTTDYLLKDELEDEEFTEETGSNVRRITLADAGEFLKRRKTASVRIAVATFLCIISVIPLLMLSAAAEFAALPISEGLAAGIGLAALLVIVAAAVAIYIYCDAQNAPFAFIDKEHFETEYGVTGMVRERQNAFKPSYTRANIVGTCICILAPLPLLATAFGDNDLLSVAMLCLTLLLAAIGVIFFTVAGVRWASMQKLLREGEYSPRGKKKSRIIETVSTVYWLAAVAVYLGWSFSANAWKTSWIVWPIAGVLFAGVICICNLLSEREGQQPPTADRKP